MGDSHPFKSRTGAPNLLFVASLCFTGLSALGASLEVGDESAERRLLELEERVRVLFAISETEANLLSTLAPASLRPIEGERGRPWRGFFSASS